MYYLLRHWLNFSIIVRILEVKRVACYARAETFTEAVVLFYALLVFFYFAWGEDMGLLGGGDPEDP